MYPSGHAQDESFTVVRGRIGFQRAGGPPEFAGEGETILFRAGEPHPFWNAGGDELRCTAYIAPAGNAGFFLGAFFASQKENGGRRPGLFDTAFLLRRYRTEFGMLDIPQIVQRLVFPLLVAIGSAAGRYGKYADAPAPMER